MYIHFQGNLSTTQLTEWSRSGTEVCAHVQQNVCVLRREKKPLSHRLFPQRALDIVRQFCMSLHLNLTAAL